MSAVGSVVLLMQQLSRRSLLAGTGTVLALGTAGCMGRTAPAGEPTASETKSIPSGLRTAFEYVYATDDSTMLRIHRVRDDGEQRRGTTTEFAEVGRPEWVVRDGSYAADEDDRGLVATGSFEVETDGKRYSANGSRGDFDLYQVKREGDEERLLATDGETLLRGSSDWVKTTLDHHEAGDATYIESTEGVRALLGAVEFTGRGTLVDDEKKIKEPFERADVKSGALPDRLLAHFRRTDESASFALAGWYAEMPEDAGKTLASFISNQLSVEDVSTEVREEQNVALATATRPYTPPEERPDTVGAPRFEGYDAESGKILFQFEQGEKLPADRYKIEINDEVYDGNWARGQEKIGEESVIAIDAGAIEPGDDLTVTYEAPDGGYTSSSGTSALGQLPFEVEFDPNERTAVLHYVDGPPLNGDRVSVEVHADSDEKDVRDVWSGEVTSGDTATLSGLPIEGYLTVRYERTGEQTERKTNDSSERGWVRIGGGRFGPPGRFDLEYDGRERMLTITRPDFEAQAEKRRRSARRHRPDQEPLNADQFEITVGGTPADRQWSDAGSEIKPGDALTLQGVPVNTTVSVAWVAEDGTRHEVARTHTVPDVTFEYSYDPETKKLTVTHAGGQPADAGKLTLRLYPDGERTVQWGSDGQVTEGDEVVVENVPEQAHVVVTYADEHIDDASIREISGGE